MTRLFTVLLLIATTAGFAQDDASSKREERIGATTLSWLTHERAAYKQLRMAADKFIELQMLAEADTKTTAQHSNEMYDSFAAKIIMANECAFDSSTNEAFTEADKQLNEIYKNVMNQQRSAAKKNGIRNAQREWISYRDAWVDFGTIKCPSLPEETWMTMITRERIAQLKELPSH